VAARWKSRAFFSLADQAVFSGAMFIVNILLARWTSPKEYGAFAVLFAIFGILSGFHSALIIERMTVYGSTRPLALVTSEFAAMALLVWYGRHYFSSAATY